MDILVSPERVYVDTATVLDFLLERRSETGRDLATPAHQLFADAERGQCELVFSDFLTEELYNHIEEGDAEDFFDWLDDCSVRVEYDQDDVDRALENYDDDEWDALHGILADKTDADVIATQNVADFRHVDHLAPARKPGDIHF